MEYINHNAGVYITPGLSGSTRGELSVELYAMLTTVGRKGFTENSRNIIRTTRDLARTVNDIPGVKVIGDAEELICVVSVGIDSEYWAEQGKSEPNIHAICDVFSKRLDSHLSYFPGGFHLCVTNNHVSNETYVSNFKKYLREVVATIDPKALPESSYGSAYMQLGKQAVFGCNVLPKEVSKAIAEAVTNSAYDFIQFDPSQVGNKSVKW